MRSASFLVHQLVLQLLQVVTVEVGHIHVLLTTLEYSMPMSSPAAPGLTSPRALRSRVLQESSTSKGVFQCFKCSEHLIECFWASYRVLWVVFQVLPVALRLWGAHVPKSSFIWCAMYSRSTWSSPRALGWIVESCWGSLQSFFLLYFPKKLKNKSLIHISCSPRVLNLNSSI